MRRSVLLLFAFCFGLFFSSSAFAVPQFSRILKENCSYCHTNWPMLNSYGKDFKRKGFPGIKNLSISDDLSMAKSVIGVRLNYRPIDKRTSKNSKKNIVKPKEKQLKIRGLHELEILVAGSQKTQMGRLSFFAEIEFEDEFSEYEGRMAQGRVSLAINPMFNISTGYMSPFWWDGNNTVSRHNAVRYKWKARGFVQGTAQTISVHGAMGMFRYGLASHANSGDLEGHDPKGKSVRLAMQVNNMLSVGGYATYNEVYNSDNGTSSGKDDKRGLDLNLEAGALSIQALVGKKFTTLYSDTVQSYSINCDGDNLSVTAIYDRFTKNGGQWQTGGLFVTRFLAENFKLQAGVEGTIEAPVGYLQKERRYTVAFDLGL